MRPTQTIRSALVASGTKSLLPESTYPSPSGRAGAVTPSASQRPLASTSASVPVSSPPAIFGRYSRFCASVPSAAISGAASTTVEK